MIDHIGLEVGDQQRSKAFYEAALAPIGISVILEFDVAVGFGSETEHGPKPYFWIQRARPPRRSTAPTSPSPPARTEEVDAFHAAALAAGGEDNGAPGPRPIYHPGYYGAFVLDPDGNNVECVCHTAAPG